jgi:hypothetical protein
VADRVLLPVNILEGQKKFALLSNDKLKLKKTTTFTDQLVKIFLTSTAARDEADFKNENHSAAKVESGHGIKHGVKVFKPILFLTAAMIFIIYIFAAYYSSSTQYASPSFHYSVPSSYPGSSYPNYYYRPHRITTTTTASTTTTQSSAKGMNLGRQRRSDYERQEEYDELM